MATSPKVTSEMKTDLHLSFFSWDSIPLSLIPSSRAGNCFSLPVVSDHIPKESQIFSPNVPSLNSSHYSSLQLQQTFTESTKTNQNGEAGYLTEELHHCLIPSKSSPPNPVPQTCPQNCNRTSTGTFLPIDTSVDPTVHFFLTSSLTQLLYHSPQLQKVLW